MILQAEKRSVTAIYRTISAGMFRSAAEFFYIATEGLSIVENVGLMGVPVPKPIRQALEVLREKNDEEQK